jgi:hypothetical protein
MVFLNGCTGSKLTIGGGGRRRGSRRQVDLCRRIDPARMHSGREAFGRLRIRIADPHDATERSLDVTRRAAKSVIELHMTEGGVEIIAVQQSDGSATQPDAFWLAGRTVQQLCRFRNLVHLLGVFRLSRELTLIAAFWFLSSGEGSRKKKSRYACGVCDQTHPDGTHGCSTVRPRRPINPLTRRPPPWQELLA